MIFALELWSAPIPSDTRQLLIVVGEGWNSPRAKLYRFERRGTKWERVGPPIHVVVGKRGMGWGLGLHTAPRKGEPVKREGDRRAPAGVFELPFLFGEGKDHFRYPYRRMTDSSRCVDDPRSRNYNRVVDANRVPRDYRSSERMKFPSGLYRYGIFVDHNPRRIPGRGSCIFLHIRKPSGAPTVGCTAMERPALVHVMKWLDLKAHPLLIQAPRSVIDRLLPDNFQLTLLR